MLAPEPETPVALDEPHGHIEFDDVQFAYSNGTEVLPNFSLNIPAGQTIALVGTTGAGKSTLVKVLSGAHQPLATQCQGLLSAKSGRRITQTNLGFRRELNRQDLCIRR